MSDIDSKIKRVAIIWRIPFEFQTCNLRPFLLEAEQSDQGHGNGNNLFSYLHAKFLFEFPIILWLLENTLWLLNYLIFTPILRFVSTNEIK